jgi:hypothetical protein
MLPGFTADRSLLRTEGNYRAVAAYGGRSASGSVLPQMSRVCSACSNWVRGTRYCCDIEITCNPWGGCTVFQICETEACGLLPWLEGIFGAAARLR